ncbi:Wadjet anti-phage system protein JetD domain-containing protein [Vibrio cholerae]
MTYIINALFNNLAGKVNKPQGLKPSLDVPISVSGFKFYHEASIAERESLHAYLNDLTHQVSWLDISFIPRGFDDHELLQRIKISSSRDFLSYFEKPVVADQISEAIRHVVDARLVLPLRFENLEVGLSNSWKKGKRYFSCDFTSYGKLIDALRVIEYLHQQPSNYSIDYRTLSVKLFKDSKWLEQLKLTISNLLKPETPELDDLEPDAVLAYWGLYRFPPSLKMKGNLTIKTTKGLLCVDNAWPFIGIPPDAIKDVVVTTEPSYVLFIENKTTFERYCREIDDGGLIIYTNGFPSRRWHSVFKSLDTALNNSVNFYHWGDIDLGGFKILRFMEELFERPLFPHQMDIIKKSDDANGVPAKELLAVITNPNRLVISDKIVSMLSKLGDEKVMLVEQETLDLITPLEKSESSAFEKSFLSVTQTQSA